MKSYLIQWVYWLLAKLQEDPPYYIPTLVRLMIPVALELMREWEDHPELSGEAKRHQVYARMIKRFPEAPKRDIAKAIEFAMDDL